MQRIINKKIINESYWERVVMGGVRWRVMYGEGDDTC